MTPPENATGLEGLAEVPWRCFHCDEIFTDRQSAADHFGLECEFDMPVCVIAATEAQRSIIEDRREWRNRALAAEAEAEQKAYEVHLLRFDLLHSRLFKGARTLRNAEFICEAWEGRALASEAALDAAPRWLAAWLRRHAEERARQQEAKNHGCP